MTVAIRHTACRYVFDAVYVDRRGDVYSCPHQFPSARPYGNLRDRHLSAILRDSRDLSDAQHASRTAALPCFSTCNLLRYHDKHATAPELPEVATLPARIRKLKLTIGWLCNARCVMCPQDHRERTQLDIAVLRERVDWTIVDEIIVEGGEPFAIALTFELWDHLTALGKKVNFLSNGLLITRELARRIARHSDYLYLSINATTAATHRAVMATDRWAKLLDAIRLLREARSALGSALRLIAHFTITSENLDEVARFIPWAEAQGFDIVNYGYNRMPSMGAVIPDLLGAAPDHAAALRRELLATLAATRARGLVRVDPSRLLYLGLVRPEDEVVDRVPVEPSGN